MRDKLKKLLPFFLFIAIVLGIQNGWRISLALNPVDSHGVGQQDVILYATQWCPYCEQARQFLDSADIPYTEHDIEASPVALREYQALGGQGVPLFKVGPAVIPGFDRNALRAAIEAFSAAK